MLVVIAAVLCGALPARAASGIVAASQPLPAELPSITTAGHQLLRDGLPFEVRGVNYIRPTGSPAACPELNFGADPRCPWEIGLIDADMERLRALGVNTIRVFLNYYVFGGARIASASYDMATPLEHLDALIASANARGIYVLPVLLAKYPQDQFGEEGLELALRLHVAPVVSHLAGRPGLLGWDLFNEPDIGSPIDQRCWDWDNGDFPLCAELAAERIAFLTSLHYVVKWYDQGRMTTVGMGFAKSYFRPAAVPSPLAALVDFYSFHYYDDDPYDSGRYAQHWYYGQGLPADLRRSIEELHALGRNKPIVVTELGFPTGEGALRDEARLRADLRASWALAREARAAGVMLWPFQDTPEAVVGDLFTAPSQ
ncbi:MAG TPA: glycoside hydrolase family 42 [Chloroflexaceae bacterium]|nr:glycoside hydrolase family 42 [Chloroflexaceae bacterium]